MTIATAGQTDAPVDESEGFEDSDERESSGGIHLGTGIAVVAGLAQAFWRKFGLLGVGVIVVLVFGCCLLTLVIPTLSAGNASATGTPVPEIDGGTPTPGAQLAPTETGGLPPTGVPDTSTGSLAPAATLQPVNGQCIAQYTVVAGDNLFRIGLRYGISTDPQGTLIAAASGINAQSILSIGQVLCIPNVASVQSVIPTLPAILQVSYQQPLPATCSQTHTVEQYQGLFEIAGLYGVYNQFDEIAQINIAAPEYRFYRSTDLRPLVVVMLLYEVRRWLTQREKMFEGLSRKALLCKPISEETTTRNFP